MRRANRRPGQFAGRPFADAFGTGNGVQPNGIHASITGSPANPGLADGASVSGGFGNCISARRGDRLAYGPYSSVLTY